MKMKIVSGKSDIESLENEKSVHLAFRPGLKDIIMIMDRCPDLELIQIPESYMKTKFGCMDDLLSRAGIKLVEGTVWGLRTDISAYVEVDENGVPVDENGYPITDGEKKID